MEQLPAHEKTPKIIEKKIEIEKEVKVIVKKLLKGNGKHIT